MAFICSLDDVCRSAEDKEKGDGQYGRSRCAYVGVQRFCSDEFCLHS